ncbi:MAG: hypothetical protein WCJ55_16050, partial [Chloroflexales bacterium]
MQLFLTPAAVGYLTQFILSALISGYLLFSLRRSVHQSTLLLSGFFIFLSGLIGALLCESALPPTQRIYAVFVQNPLLGAALICLLQFTYYFPT